MRGAKVVDERNIKRKRKILVRNKEITMAMGKQKIFSQIQRQTKYLINLFSERKSTKSGK
jgi:hypothetical protein